MSHRPFARSLGLASLLLFTGCGGDGIDRLSVTCEPTPAKAGETIQCMASALDSDNQPLPVAPRVVWSISGGAQDNATVEQDGKVSTMFPGEVLVVARTLDSSPVEGWASLRVLEGSVPRLTSVQVTCERTPLLVGRTMPCTASASDQLSQPFPVTGFTWTSDNEAVAKVDAEGKVSIVGLGAAKLTARATQGRITQQGVYSLQLKAPTEHRGPITASETWRRADNPHLVTTTLVVGGPGDPILSLESGVDVLFAPGAALMIGSDEQNPGTLQVNGSTDRKVLFTARSGTPQPGDWAGVYFLQTSATHSSKLNHTTLEYAGGELQEMPATPGVQQLRGALNVLANPEAKTPGTRVAVNSVEVRESQEHGFVLGTRLSASATVLHAHDNGKAGLVVAANAVGFISRDSQFTDNGINEVLVWGGEVTQSQRWPRLDVAYRIIGLVDSLPAYISVGAAARPTLTLEAGTRLLMPAGSAFLVGLSEPGRLVADGNEDEPIRFMADTASPTPGHWSGLHFLEARSSWISYAHVSHAGARLQGSLGGGAVNVYKEGVFSMSRSILRASSGCGVSVSPGMTMDFSAPESGNSFLDLVGEKQCTQQ